MSILDRFKKKAPVARSYRKGDAGLDAALVSAVVSDVPIIIHDIEDKYGVSLSKIPECLKEIDTLLVSGKNITMDEARGLGSLLGELLRERFGGHWEWYVFDGTEVESLVIRPGKKEELRVFPINKIKRQIDDRDPYGISAFWSFVEQNVDGALAPR